MDLSVHALGAQLLRDLDARHEELLRQLEELDNRVANVLIQWQALRLTNGPAQVAETAQ